MSGDQLPTKSALSHTEREQEAQNAHRWTAMLKVSDLRIVRAQLADMLETDLPPISSERLTIRGEIVHKRIHELESSASWLARAGRSIKRGLADVPTVARKKLLELPKSPQSKSK